MYNGNNKNIQHSARISMSDAYRPSHIMGLLRPSYNHLLFSKYAVLENTRSVRVPDEYSEQQPLCALFLHDLHICIFLL